MRTRVRGWRWRWRENPLRRRSDVVEAWTALVVAVLLLVGAPLAGVFAASWAHSEAQATAAAQRADRHRVRAEVVGATPDRTPTVRSGRAHAYTTAVRWTQPGEGARTAEARVPAGTRHGDVVEVWFDSRGRNVAPPPNSLSVWQYTVTMGVCGTGGAAGVILLGRCVARQVSTRHRLAEWEEEWTRTEPVWTRRRWA
ncbi:hypothetical protein [Streptomyces sp. NPDC046909]|uniref:Rv1733c family protein n=1 Tax=Streptomyces sp. NPDC046909 TaxID=3155617 RepID=UPI0033F134AE